jgi:nucleotide-binding universal stress UspA family protein
MREIVVGVDASDASMDAARFAGGLAAKAGSALMVVHVRQARTPRAVERRIQDRLVAALEGPAVSWTFEIHDGDPARRLRRVARERKADLIVVGACRHSGTERLGSVSNWLVHHADHPVLIVRDRACELREVVVGVDAGDRGAKPVLFAGRLARDTGAHLTVVYVRHVPAGYMGPPIVGTAQLEAYFDRAAARLRCRPRWRATRTVPSWSSADRSVPVRADRLGVVRALACVPGPGC